MQTKFLLAGIALLSLPLSLPAYAQDKGNNGQGSEKSKSGERKGGAGESDRRSNKGSNKGAEKAERRSSNAAGQNSRSAGKNDADNRGKSASSANKQLRAERKSDQRDNSDRAAIIPRVQEGRENVRMRSFENGRYTWREPSFQGCPPGLAKKGNGCLPPGQARKLGGIDDRGTRWLRYSNWFGENSRDDWRYDRGYAYRIDPATNLVQGIVPLLGGALFSGNTWPQSFTDYQVSTYHERFFGSGDTNGVRYANGAIFKVNPETQMIGSIAGLLTGDNWNVGSPAPQGYELYNVPASYRSQYADTASSSYRYNDGYVHEIDPTTQLVRKIIELIV